QPGRSPNLTGRYQGTLPFGAVDFGTPSFSPKAASLESGSLFWASRATPSFGRPVLDGAAALSFTILTFQDVSPSLASDCACLPAGIPVAAQATSTATAMRRTAALKTTVRVPRLAARTYFGPKTLAV